MEQDYDAEAGHDDFSETKDFAEMLERYFIPETGYKDQLSKKNLRRIYERGITYK